MVKKFFKEPTKAQISKGRDDFSEDPIDLEKVTEGSYLITTSPLPESFKNEPVKFQKHGPEVVLKRFKSINDAEESALQGVRPLDLRREAFGKKYYKNGKLTHSCYSFVPLIGNEKRRRRVGLVQILDGAQIFAFSESLRQKLGVDKEEFYDDIKLPGIKVKPYHDSKGVAKDGAQLILRVPSVERDRRWQYSQKGIAVLNNSRKLAISLGFGTDHVCKFKTYKELRYPFLEDSETSNIDQICKHETAGAFAIIDYYVNVKHNLTSMETTQIAIPSGRIVELYKRMLDSWLIYDETLEKKDKLRKPLQAEKEIVLDAFVKKYGHDICLYRVGRTDGALGNQDWGLRGE